MLRCLFWLSVVYSSILADIGGRDVARGRDDIVRAARTAIAVPAGAAAAGLSAYCARQPGACLADSARLTALVAAGGDDATEPVEAPPSARRGPIAESRHRPRGAMQARMP